MDAENSRHLISKLRWPIGYIILLLVSLMGIHNMRVNLESFDWGSGRSAVLATNFTIPKESWVDFFERLESFARANKFEFSKSRIHPTKEQFSIDFTRADIAMSGANIFDPLEFDLAFYIDPSKGGTPQKAEDLERMLEQSMSTVPGLLAVRRSGAP